MASVSVHLGSVAGGTGGRFSAKVDSIGDAHYVVLDVVELGADGRERATVNLFLGASELAQLVDVARSALVELVDANVADSVDEARALLDGPAHDDEGGPYDDSSYAGA